MKKGFKRFTLVLFALMLAASMAFAGGNQEQGGDGEEGPVEITFKHIFSGPRGELIDSYVQEFNASQEKIVVTHQHVPGWYGGLLEQLQADAVANQLPEVALMGLSESNTMRRELGAVSLEQYIESDNYDTSDFIPQLLSLAQDTSTGEQFALPYAISTPLIFVNNELFEEAGIEMEGDPKTWMDLKEYAKKVSDLGDDISGISFQLDFDTWQFQVLLESFGGQMASAETRRIYFNNEPGQRVMDYWLTMMHEDESFPNISGGEAADNFINGKLGIIVATTGNYGTFSKECDFNMGVHILPEWDDREHKNPRRVAAGGSNIYILPDKSQAKQDAAWEFIKFALNKESSKKILDMGYMSARSSLKKPEIRAYEMIEDIVNWYNWPDSGARITALLRGNIIAAFNKEMGGKEALDDAAAQIRDILGW